MGELDTDLVMPSCVKMNFQKCVGAVFLCGDTGIRECACALGGNGAVVKPCRFGAGRSLVTDAGSIGASVFYQIIF